MKLMQSKALCISFALRVKVHAKVHAKRSFALVLTKQRTQKFYFIKILLSVLEMCREHKTIIVMLAGLHYRSVM